MNETIDAVANILKWDIEYFGYEFGESKYGIYRK